MIWRSERHQIHPVFLCLSRHFAQAIHPITPIFPSPSPIHLCADPLCEAHETTAHATSLIRVLRFNGETEGDWVPDLSAETLRSALKSMVRTRAMDERMFNMQRQGKMSFYMKSTGEEAVSVGHALALNDSCLLYTSPSPRD